MEKEQKRFSNDNHVMIYGVLLFLQIAESNNQGP